ncbi:hypothetical protein [Sellimonas intestinalis]|uniref:hypothetical protein n=1 Tax=Sellimonas intestinalis TaxID=1653434 RepID=UPI0039907F66
MNRYYDLFPEEKSALSEEIEAMYLGRNYQERCMKILAPLIGDPRTRVTKENAEIVNDISVCFCMDLLNKKCANPEMDNEVLKKHMMDMLRFIIEK